MKLAHWLERKSCKLEVAGSNPVFQKKASSTCHTKTRGNSLTVRHNLSEIAQSVTSSGDLLQGTFSIIHENLRFDSSFPRHYSHKGFLAYPLTQKALVVKEDERHRLDLHENVSVQIRYCSPQ